MWFCENCNNQLHEASFAMTDIVNQLPLVINHFMESEELRTCDACGTKMDKM